jgi:hypothetical protein
MSDFFPVHVALEKAAPLKPAILLILSPDAQC